MVLYMTVLAVHTWMSTNWDLLPGHNVDPTHIGFPRLTQTEENQPFLVAYFKYEARVRRRRSSRRQPKMDVSYSDDPGGYGWAFPGQYELVFYVQ